jgi:hypothetical protein
MYGMQTSEAKAAFEGGGGGKRAEAQRLLAAAKAAASGKSGAAGKKESGQAAAAGQEVKAGQGAGTGAAAAAASASGKDNEGGDWRLRAPERSGTGPHFKPGALTWDTEVGEKLKQAAGSGSKVAGSAACLGTVWVWSTTVSVRCAPVTATPWPTGTYPPLTHCCLLLWQDYTTAEGRALKKQEQKRAEMVATAGGVWVG